MNNKTAEIKIGNRTIGPEFPPFVIAEVGINHEGDVNKALQMVDAAVDAGSEVIKFQCHITEQEMIPTDMTLVKFPQKNYGTLSSGVNSLNPKKSK